MNPATESVPQSVTAKKEYEMKFSDDGDNNDDSQNKDHRLGNRRNPNNKSFVSVIILMLAFVVIIVLMVYFFVFRKQSSSLVYNDSSVVYNVDYKDASGNPGKDGTADDLKEFRLTDDNKTIGDYVLGPTGDLAKYLLDPQKYEVKFTAIQSNQTDEIVILNGQYKTANSAGGFVTYPFQAVLTRQNFEAYVLPIINYTRVTGTNGKSYNYYNASNYLYQIQATNTLSSWIVPLIIGVLVIVLMYFFLNRMYKSMGSGGGAGPMAGFVNNVGKKQNGSKIRFRDVAGCDEAKAELVEMVDYFHATDKYTRLGAKLPHGVLLVGPPGTGKTLLAKAVAGEANVPFYSVSGSDFVEMYVGVGASRVRSLFKTAKQNAPCLVFIDEIDAVGRQRGAGVGGGNDEREQTLNELLVEMDGFEDNNGIIVMAATNRNDVLDPALTRPGRFDRTITVDLPDKEGRSAILKVHSRNKKLAPDVSFDSIATRTTGFSGADLANIMNDAAILAVRANRNAITTADIDEAIDRAISGPAKKSHLEDHERKQVAYHEAGHAVIGIFLPYSDKVQKITIIPRGRTGGHVLMTPDKDHFLLTKNQLLARITGYLGGRTSEEIFFGDVSTGASNDIEVATNIARGMVTEYGMSDLGPIQYEKAGGSVFLGRDYGSTQANYSTQVAFEIDKAIRQIIDQCHADAVKLLTEHREDVILIAETLIQNETITADQIDYLLKNRKLPDVDEHKMTSDGPSPKNINNIILYPGYESFYRSIDEILEGKPSRLVITVSVKEGTPISEEQFVKACVTDAKDPAHIGVLFIDEAHSANVSMTIETFASHLESYADVDVLLIKTDGKTVQKLSSKFGTKLQADSLDSDRQAMADETQKK